MKNSYKKIIAICLLIVVVQISYAQTGGPGPATGAPIDGISGLIMMGLAAIFGKKFINKK